VTVALNIAVLLVLLLSALSTTTFVNGFAPTIIRQQAVTTHHHLIRRANNNVGTKSNRNSSSSSSSRSNNSSTRLNFAVPSAVWWILGHNILPFCGVPFVVNGTRNGGWYSKIDKPSWTPPDRSFAPVWTFLYTLMGLAVSRISSVSSRASLLSSGTATTTTTITNNPTFLLLLWGIHFGLNVAWVPTFFGLQRFRLSLIVSCVMVATLVCIIPLFYMIDPIAAYLLLPYGVWLSFATLALNVAMCRLNPTKNGYNNGMFEAQLKKLQENAATYAGV